MRARSMAALLVAVCLGCGSPPDVYPPEVVRNFLDACTPQAGRRTCRCALDALQRRFSIEEFRAFEARMRGGEMPKEMVDAVSECR
jgi:hypothetical protein